MGKSYDFIAQFSVFLVGLISIGIGRIWGCAFHLGIDQILSTILTIGGGIVIFGLIFALIYVKFGNKGLFDEKKL